MLLHAVRFADIRGERVNNPPLAPLTAENPRMGNIEPAIVKPLGDHIAKEAITPPKDNIPWAKRIQLGRGEAYTVFVFSHLPLFLLGIYIEKEVKPSP